MNARPIQTKSDSGFAFPGGAQAFQRRLSALPTVILHDGNALTLHPARELDLC